MNILYKLSGHYDYFVEIIFKSLKELENFKELMGRFCSKIDENHVVEDLIEEGFLS